MAVEEKKLLTENLPYPSGRMLRTFYKSPILLYRLGLGSLIGRLIMILTTTGRKSGLPRHTAIEFHEYKGRKYVVAGWRGSAWYKNILANPLVTLQTASGTEHARARRVTTIEDLREVWEFAERSPYVQGLLKVTGTSLTWESFLALKDRLIILTFDPTEEATPAPLEADLRGVTFAVAGIIAAIGLIALLQRLPGARHHENEESSAG